MFERPDLLGVLETAYHVEGSNDAWLQRVADEVDRATDNELGCNAHFLDASDLGAVHVSPTVASPRAPRIDISGMHALGNAGDVRPFYARGGPNTGSALVGRSKWRLVREQCRAIWPDSVRDAIGVVAVDAQRRGCALCLGQPRITRLRRDERVRYARLGMHVAAALRLRRALEGEKLHADLGGGAEAVLDPGGRVLDAENGAADPGARTELRDMARRLDHARTRLRREDADLALEAWTALVSGRWTLLDHFDTDGRHFLVARLNPPDLVEPLALEPRERMVASAIALGRPQKLVGYELGLPRATVSRLLKSALGKLGLGGPAELANVLGAFVPPPGG